MRELSIEEKAQLYDGAIKVAMSKIKNNKDHVLYEEDITDIFPELKESEDMQIMKEIAEFIYISAFKPKDIKKKEKWLDWLEKQGEKDKGVRDVRCKYLDELLYADDIYKMAMNDAMVEEAKNKAIDAISKLEISKLLGVEKKETLCDTCKKTQPSHSCQDITALGRCAVEYEQYEQEPSDNVESKFNVGDWILIDNLCRITSIDNNKNYHVKYCDSDKEQILSKNFCETYFHLWSIQDAQDGDVLSTPNYIYIFNSIDKETETVSYYFLMKKSDEHFSFGDYKIHDEILNSVPATKEQRDFLFQRMREVGCKFNFEKKELNEIEQEPVNYKKQLMDEMTECVETYIQQNPSELNENKRLYTMNVYYPSCCLEFEEGIEQGIACCKKENKPILIDLNGIFLRITPLSTTEDVMNEYNKCTGGNTVVIKEKTNPINQWNSDDESWLNGVITDIECEVLFANCSREIADMKIHWLKSLKDRMQPQVEWSEEDKNIIFDAETWLDTLCDYLKDGSSEYIPDVRDVISKLKSLKGRIPPKQEWSEEDSMHLTNAILAAEKEWGVESCTSKWLKSLRPQKQWKPSKEQLDGLSEALAHIPDEYDVPSLTELFEQLKQL